MVDPKDLGRLLVGTGILLALVGIVLLLGDRLPFVSRLGRLPGDVVFRLGPVTVYAPLLSSLLLSIILTVLLTVLFRRH